MDVNESGRKSADGEISLRTGFPVDPVAGFRAGEDDTVAHAHLLGEGEDFVVAGEPVMIELLQRPVPSLVFEAGSEPADAVSRFVDCHLMARVSEVPGGCQSGGAGADDGDVHLVHGCLPGCQ